MNLLMYFCIPLVVTGQIIGDIRYIQVPERETSEEAGSPETSETETYSKFAYGSQVQYRNLMNDFMIDERGELVRRPSVIEDSGEVGKPSIYNSNTRNNDHPSFIVSNVYASIRDKKTGGNKNIQIPSPLAYGLPEATDSLSQNVDVGASYKHRHQHLQEVGQPVKHSLSPVVQQVPLVPQHVLLQDPQTGQLVQSPLYQNGLIPLYQSQVAPQVTYLTNGDNHVLSQQVPVTQKVLPTVKTGGASLYSPQLVEKLPATHQKILVKNAGVSVFQPPFYVRTDVAPTSSHVVKATGEEVHADPILKTEAAQYYHYQPQLLKTEGVPFYQTPVLKTLDGVVYQDPVLQTQVSAHQTPVLTHSSKHAITPLYYHPSLLKSVDGNIYQGHVLNSADGHVYQGQGHVLKSSGTPVLLKSPENAIYHLPHLKSGANPLLIKSPTGEVYKTAVTSPVAHDHYSQAPVILKDGSGLLYQQQHVLNDLTAHNLLKTSGIPTLQHQHPHHTLKTTVPLAQHHLFRTATGELVEAPLLPSPQVKAGIVPTAEDHVQHGLHYPTYAYKQPQYIQYFTPRDAIFAEKHPKILVQKSVLRKPPVLTEKAVLKTALSPVYTNPAVDTRNAIFKAPLHTHFVQKGYLEQDLPAQILTSQKALVNTLLASDDRKLRGGKAIDLFAGAKNLELIPSLSYGYSYSLYPKDNGQYGPPRHSHRHHK